MTLNYLIIGKRIKAARKKKKLTQDVHIVVVDTKSHQILVQNVEQAEWIKKGLVN